MRAFTGAWAGDHRRVTLRRRLDAELVRRGLVPSRETARTAIESGRVLVGGAPAPRPSRLVAPGEAVVITGPAPRFVSRGGEKLDRALDGFAIDVAGRVALDAGASTGGFTDCLLQRGAAHVVAVDVGYGQLDARLRADARVLVMERRNVRHLVPTDLGMGRPSIVVADLAFISLRTVAHALVGLAAPGAAMVLLVKPQFEVGRRDASRAQGVIREPQLWARSISGVIDAYGELGATIMDAMPSPVRGADGNAEFLVHLQAPGPIPAATPGRPRSRAGSGTARLVAKVVAEAVGGDSRGHE